MANLYKYYSDDSFVTGDSPVVLDFATDLTAEATSGTPQTANSLTIINTGNGAFQLELSFDGTTYGTPIHVAVGGGGTWNQVGIKKARITWIENTSYKIYAFADKVASVDIKQFLPINPNGGLDVNIQDQITAPLNLFFTQAIGAPTTVSADSAIDDTSITITSTTNFVDGTYVGIFCPGAGRFYFGEQLGAPVGNVISLDTPLDFAFEIGDQVIPLTRDMGVDGSTTREVFEIQGPGSGALEIDLTRIMVAMTTDSAVDLSKFGDLPKLAKGIVLRRKNGIYQNVWNVKTNGELANLCFDYTPYSASNPAQGIDGALFRDSYGGQEKRGVVIRLGADEALQLIIQDDLSDLKTTDASFRMIAEGHVVD